MKRQALIVSVLAVIAIAGFAYFGYVGAKRMTLEQAVAVAQKSECGFKGEVGENGTYNPSSDTWWIDFTPSSQYAQTRCSPACVVHATSSVAEINWRCTGAILPATYDDLIQVDAPLKDASVQSPLIVTGKARGSWYFEAVFPINVVDSTGKILGSGQGRAQGEWTTNEYVPFTASVTFTKPNTSTGELVVQNDNPSGEPENQKELRIPLRFGLVDTFSEDGTITRNNPGQKPDVWYLIYEKPGSPALSVELDLNSGAAPYIDMAQGKRVHVDGIARGTIVKVTSIIPITSQ